MFILHMYICIYTHAYINIPIVTVIWIGTHLDVSTCDVSFCEYTHSESPISIFLHPLHDTGAYTYIHLTKYS